MCLDHSLKIYVASSWRNAYQPGVIETLSSLGYEVYDFRHPKSGDNGFHWSQIDPAWKSWSVPEFRNGLRHDLARTGFGCVLEAMRWADVCVLVLPCGRGAHLEAGWFIGQDKPTFIHCPEKIEPELMYSLAFDLTDDLSDLARMLRHLTIADDPKPDNSQMKNDAHD